MSSTVRLHPGSEDSEEAQIDTTIQEKNITFPTDTKLQLKIVQSLRQSYRFVLNVRYGFSDSIISKLHEKEAGNRHIWLKTNSSNIPILPHAC